MSEEIVEVPQIVPEENSDSDTINFQPVIGQCIVCDIDITAENQAKKSKKKCYDCFRKHANERRARNEIVIKNTDIEDPDSLSEVEERILKRYNKKNEVKKLKDTIIELEQKKKDIKDGKIEPEITPEIREEVKPKIRLNALRKTVKSKTEIVSPKAEAKFVKQIQAQTTAKTPEPVIMPQTFEMPTELTRFQSRNLFKRDQTSFIPKQVINLAPKVPGRYRR